MVHYSPLVKPLWIVSFFLNKLCSWNITRVHSYSVLNCRKITSLFPYVLGQNLQCIYIYIYIYKTKICEKLDKSNVYLIFRCVIFHTGFISFSRTSSRQGLFSGFLYLKTCEESWRVIVVVGQVGSDLKSNVSGFCLKLELRRKTYESVCMTGEFAMTGFHGKGIDYNLMSQKIAYIVISGL